MATYALLFVHAEGSLPYRVEGCSWSPRKAFAWFSLGLLLDNRRGERHTPAESEGGLKTMTCSRSTKTWGSLLVCFLVALGGAEETVLCIGPDGHIAVEPSEGVCAAEPCSRAESDGSSKVGVPVMTTSECGPCQDIPLPSWSAPRMNSRRSHVALAQPAASTPALLPAIDGLEATPVAQAYLSPIAASSTVDSLRTVVLLI
jgi:hypothetical protein